MTSHVSMGGAIRRLVAIVKETVSQFFAERVQRMAAALAFYTAFSLAPLLIFAVAIAGLVFGRDAAAGRLVGEIEALVGSAGAITIQEVIDNASQPRAGTIAAMLAVVTLFLGLTGVVGELQDSLNTIWNVKADPAGGILAAIKRRFASFALVLGIGFILLVSLVLSTALTAAGSYAGEVLGVPESVLYVTDLVVSLAIITGLFALIYAFVPDAKLLWRDVWGGAVAAALLFVIGKFALGYYLSHSGFASTYGAAGSLVVLLLWVYYSAQILFVGAELSQVWTTSRRKVVAMDGAHRTHRPEKRNPLRFRPRAAEKE